MSMQGLDLTLDGASKVKIWILEPNPNSDQLASSKKPPADFNIPVRFKLRIIPLDGSSVTKPPASKGQSKDRIPRSDKPKMDLQPMPIKPDEKP